MVTKRKPKKPGRSQTPLYEQVKADEGFDPGVLLQPKKPTPLQQLIAGFDPCLDCGQQNMDTEACPNNRGYCLDCCHCSEHDPDFDQNLSDGKGR